MLDTNNTEYFKVKGIQINDPSINHDDTLMYAPAAAFAREWANIFNLNSTFMDRINNASAACGFDEFMDKALQFPPKGLLPTAPSSNPDGCATFDDIVIAGNVGSRSSAHIRCLLTSHDRALRQSLLQFLSHHRLLSLSLVSF